MNFRNLIKTLTNKGADLVCAAYVAFQTRFTKPSLGNHLNTRITSESQKRPNPFTELGHLVIDQLDVLAAESAAWFYYRIQPTALV